MPDKEKKRAAVIGVGSMGKNHARVLAELDTVELVAVADSEPARLNITARRLAVKPYQDYNQLIEQEELDFVVVAVPSVLHRQVVDTALQKQLHVLVEKPVATSIDDAKAMIKLASEQKVLLGAGHIERFNPVIKALKDRLDQGMLGTVYLVTIERIGPYPSQINDTGVLLDLGIHDIDLLLYMVAGNIAEICVQTGNFIDRGREDTAVSMLRFDHGVLGVLKESWLSPRKVRQMIVYGERGCLQADLLTQDLTFYENRVQRGQWDTLQLLRGVAEGDVIRYYLERGEPLRRELEAFVQAVNGQEPFPVMAQDVLAAMETLQRLIEAARK